MMKDNRSGPKIIQVNNPSHEGKISGFNRDFAFYNIKKCLIYRALIDK